MTEEVRKPEAPAKKKKTAKKESPARRMPPKPQAQVTPKVTTALPQPSAAPPTESRDSHETKPVSVAAKADPDDIYATLDWDTNPPINGFYEMMMGLTPERRKELREAGGTASGETAACPGRESRAGAGNTATRNTAGSCRHSCRSRNGSSCNLPFPEMEAEKPKEEAPTFRRVPTTARRKCTCVKARWWLTVGVVTSVI